VNVTSVLMPALLLCRPLYIFRKDLLKSGAGSRGSRAKPAVAWTIESRGFGSNSLPSDINAAIVDENSDGTTAGRIFVAGQGRPLQPNLKTFENASHETFD